MKLEPLISQTRLVRGRGEPDHAQSTTCVDTNAQGERCLVLGDLAFFGGYGVDHHQVVGSVHHAVTGDQHDQVSADQFA